MANPMPAIFVYLPLEHPTVVINSCFLAKYPVDLTITAENESAVTDFSGTNIFRIKNKRFSLHSHRKLMDASGNVLVSMSQKVMSAHGRWQSFRGNSEEDLLFSVKKSSILQGEPKLDVFLAENTKEKVPDFRIKGIYLENSCIIYLGNTTKIVARMYRDRSMESESFRVTIYPNVDYAFIVSLVMVTIKELSQSSKSEKYGVIAGGVEGVMNILSN